MTTDHPYRPLTIVEDNEFHQLHLKQQQSLSSSSTRKKTNNSNHKDDDVFSPSSQTNSHRFLSSDDAYYLVDADGNDYEPYSLSWRYLGMYRDCSQSNYEGACDNVLLWAAYHDPGYSGNEIGEYAIYNTQQHRWDKTGCQSHFGGRCVKLNCHEDGNWFHRYRLVGIFKETNGLEEWSEQLFKHQGYCIFPQDDDYGYDFLQEQRENNLPYDCEWYANAIDTDGTYHSFYRQVTPAQHGLIRIGLYEDESCTTESIYEVQDVLYATSGGDDTVVEEFETTVRAFNRGLQTFQVCQPCRAYNLYPDSSNNNNNNHKRHLSNDSNDNNNKEDGEGDDEMWGFNCYDDAGYTNCNQCYKFFTQTELEAASTSDLQEASAQGTILSIRDEYGQSYGSGHYPPNFPWITEQLEQVSTEDLFLGIMGVVMLFFICSILCMSYQLMRQQGKQQPRRRQRQGRHLPDSFQENLMTTPTTKQQRSKPPDDDTSSSSSSSSDDDESTTQGSTVGRFFSSSSSRTKNTATKTKSWKDSAMESWNKSHAVVMAQTEVAMDHYANFLYRQGLVVEPSDDDDSRG